MSQTSKIPVMPKVEYKNRSKRVQLVDGIIQKVLILFSSVSIFTTLGIVLIMAFESFQFFEMVSIIDFLTDTKWTPLFVPKHFGILPLLSGTLLVALLASLVCLPFGLGAAIYLSEYAGGRTRRILTPILEVLAGIPTVVYGYFALTLVTPTLQKFIPQLGVFNALSAGIVVGIMIIPMVASISQDAMLAVPRGLREGAYGLGATKLEVATKVVVPAALSGIIASFVLAISRAIGETMITTLAAGGTPKLALNPVESVQTMTAFIVQVSLGDTPYGSLEHKTIFAVGMTLFTITLLMNIIAQYISKRFREVY